MTSNAETPQKYLENLPEERQAAMAKLRETILKNLPEGFEEHMDYGMIGYSVPKSLYPDGYHCDPKKPLPFMSIASQKKFIAVYHMGIYANKKLLDWFTAEYPNYMKTKLDMGKSCIRFKKIDQIPYPLIGELAAKITPEEWISLYESAVKNPKKGSC